jgi:hypothetical protein
MALTVRLVLVFRVQVQWSLIAFLAVLDGVSQFVNTTPVSPHPQATPDGGLICPNGTERFGELIVIR